MISRTALSGSSSRSSTRVEDAPELRIAGHRGSQMRASHDSTRPRTPRPRGSCAAAPRAARRSRAPRGAPRAPSQSSGTFSPSSASVSRIAGRSLGLGERDDRAHLVEHRLRRRVIHLVDRDHVGDLHDPGLQRLHRVARAGHEDEEDGVGDPRDLDLALPGADRLDEHDVLPRRVEQEHGLQASPRRARRGARACPSSGCRRRDRGSDRRGGSGRRGARRARRGSTGRPRRRRPSCSRSRTCATSAPIRLDLPTPGGPVTPTTAGAAGLGIELADERIRERVAVLDERDRARERAPIAAAHAGDELLERPLPARHAGTLCGAVRSHRQDDRRASSFAARLDLLEQRRDALERRRRACRSPRLLDGSRRCTLMPVAERRDRRLRARLERVLLLRRPRPGASAS